MENNTNTFCVHFQTFKNRINVEMALESFRKFNPSVAIRMISDGGEDFSDLASKYNCIFDYEDINIYPKAIFLGHPIWKDINTTHSGARIWLRRLYDTCKLFTDKWVFLMEDDVITVNNIKEWPTTHGVGDARYIKFKQPLIDFLEKVNKVNTQWGYNLSGGAMIDREFFIQTYEKHIDEFNIEELMKLDDRIGGWSDVLLSAFVIYGGGQLSSWRTTFNGKHANTPSHAAFVHGCKDLYVESQGSKTSHTDILDYINLNK